MLIFEPGVKALMYRPRRYRRGILFVATRGIDVLSKDGGCRGLICVFRLFCVLPSLLCP